MRRDRLRQRVLLVVLIAIIMVLSAPYGYATDGEVLRPRVPSDQLDEVRTWTNPIPPTEDNIEKGKALFHGKAFCLTCHGRDGRGLADVEGLRGKLPRNFTDKVWQATRMDGELFWILKNGSPGTDMAAFVPLVLTEEEAWHVVLYVRSFVRP